MNSIEMSNSEMFHIINAEVQSLGVNSDHFQSEIVKGQKFNRPIKQSQKRKMSNIPETEDGQGDRIDTPRDQFSDIPLDVPIPNVIPYYAKYRTDNTINNEQEDAAIIDVQKYRDQEIHIKALQEQVKSL